MSNTIKIAKHYALRWQTWLHGLIGAAIGGGSSSVIAIGIDPKVFNFDEGFHNIVKMFVGASLASAILYLSKSPVPPMEEEKE